MTSAISVTGLRTQSDIEGHLELMRTVFGESSRVDVMVRKWIDHYPSVTLDDFFVAKSRGKIVAALNLLPLKWEIGVVPLAVAELACVATHPNYRHMGLQKMLMKEYDQRVSDQGYDLSAIEGIPYYYRQFGYEYALPLSEETRIGLDQIPESNSTGKIRPFRKSDLTQAAKLLRAAKQRFYVHSIRDEGVWKMQQETRMVAEREFHTYAVEKKGKMIAYFRLSENSEAKILVLTEMTDVNYEQARLVLAFLGTECKRRGLQNLNVIASYHEPFTEFLASAGGIKQFPQYAWQLRVIDHVRLFTKMRPLFERRLSASIYRGFTENINLNLYHNTIKLIIKHGKLEKIQKLDTCDHRDIRMNPEVFTQLIVGYRSREELETIYPDFMIRPSHRYLIDVMFPKKPSFIHTEY
jgi:predicted acetyltransferase